MTIDISNIGRLLEMYVSVDVDSVGKLLERMIEVRADEVEQELRHDQTNNYECNIIKAETIQAYLKSADSANYEYYLQLMDLENENIGTLTEKTYIQGFKDGLSLLIFALGKEKVSVFGKEM